MAIVLDDLPQEELRFRFSSGRLCLDFVATVGERWRRSFERLRSPDDLARWIVAAGLLEEPPPVSAHELELARELRESIYRTVRPGASRSPQASDAGAINRAASAPPLAPRLGADGRRVAWSSAEPATASLSSIARDAIDLVTGPLIGRVRECAARDCALLFLDTSRAGRRRWCAMRACGNRAKTKAYRRRQANR